MNHIENYLRRIVAGEPVSGLEDGLDQLFIEMRAANVDPVQLQQIGRFALSQITATLKATIHTERAVLTAKGPLH